MTRQRIPRPLLQPSSNAIVAAVVLFSLGTAAMYDIDKEGRQRRQKALLVAAIGAAIIGAAFGGDSRQSILAYVPWSMLLATAIHRMSTTTRREDQASSSTDFAMDMKS